MFDLNESPSIESYEFSDGDKRWYGVWSYEIHGYSIASIAHSRYGKKLTKEEVEAIVSDVDERIDEHVWELIEECIENREGRE